ncbi:MAG: hypothetical protein ACYDAH_13085, partial [Steroidobacteraceae bacterium]
CRVFFVGNDGSTSSLDVSVVRTILRSYEPVFGGIVAILAAALLCFVVFVPSPGRLDSPTVHLMWYSGAGITWGLLPVVGYRSAKRKGIALEEPMLGTAVGCVLLGLILALVTVCLYEFAHDTWYAYATGLVTVVLLCIGAIVGIREGTWK